MVEPYICTQWRLVRTDNGGFKVTEGGGLEGYGIHLQVNGGVQRGKIKNVKLNSLL